MINMNPLTDALTTLKVRVSGKREFTVHLYREFRQVRSGIPAATVEEALQWALDHPAEMGEPIDCEGRIISALVDVKDETETLIEERDTEFFALTENLALWRARAKEAGWIVVNEDPSPQDDHRVKDGPLYHHPDTDRVWPLDDPKGAAIDVGMREDGTWED